MTNNKEAKEQLKWYFERDDGISADPATKQAYEMALHALESNYENAFKIACALLNGDVLYGIDSNTIFSEIMKKDGCICSVDYEVYILTHLNTLMYGEEKDG